jgi:hypothetical protein
MATQDTFRTYQGDGTVTTDFPVTFPYELPSEVVVSRDGVDESFVFISASVIRIATPLASGQTLTIQRVTDIDAPAVVWKNGSGTTGSQLNAMVRQLINSMQEARDTALRGLFRKPTGEYDFQNGRAANAADPVADQDLVTKKWVEAAPTANISRAVDAANEAHSWSDKASLWAESPVNTQVAPGQYSAKHWALTAQAVSGGITAQGVPVTPAGGISSSTVQAALQELDTEKADAAATTSALAAKAPLASPSFTGNATFAIRPTFNGKTPWDSGNFDPTTKQAALGFTPVQQGTGVGQTTNVIKIGWDGTSRLKATVDAVDLGTVWTEYNVSLLASTSGYLKLPNGLILQWGQSTQVAADYNITFPTAFPNAVLNIVTNIATSPPAGQLYAASWDTATKTNFSVHTRYTNGTSAGAASGLAVSWFAVGN